MTRNQSKELATAPAPVIAGGVCEPAESRWEQLLVCPACGAGLTQHDKLRCGPCQKVWPVVNGVPVFAEGLPYRGEISRESMLKVNTLIREKPWKTALLEFEDASVRKAAEMISNIDVANWHWLTGLGSRSRALVVGAGLGTNSHALSFRFREVFALEPLQEQVDFMQRRFAQEGIGNVKILRASFQEIPLAAKTFDLVVLNGVLEWVASGREGDPKALQVAALRRAFQLIAPGGYLYVGMENRIAWQYFTGAPDAHCGLPYVTVLPRPVANWYARRRGQAEGYRNYLYSIRGYRKLFAAVGFTDVQFYVAIPNHHTPRFLVPLEQNVFSYYHRNFDPLRSGPLASLISRVLSGLGLLKHLQKSFAIVARREA